MNRVRLAIAAGLAAAILATSGIAAQADPAAVLTVPIPAPLVKPTDERLAFKVVAANGEGP